MIGKKAERLNNLRDDINGFHFNEALFISKLIYIASCSILAVAVALCIIPPLFDGMSFGKWIGRAVCVAAAGTVCELTGISILTCISGILDAFQNKIYFRSIDLFFFSASITSVLFNKTGIITTGEFEVSGIYPVRISEDELLFLASYAEAYSSHPLAGAILRYSGINVDKERILRRKEELGMGSVIQLVGSQIIAAGNIEFMEKLGVSGNFSPSGTTSVYIAVNKIYVGRIDFLDNIRHDAESTVQKLKKLGVANIAIMTGDSTTVATKVGRQIGISEIYADYQPQDKVNRMQYILDTQEPDDKLANIGDGVHDAELLALSDIGVVLGNDDGSVDADVIIDSHELSFIPEMIRIPQKVRKTLKLDSAAALLADILIVILSICGIMPLWSVILTQFAVQLLLCLNINN
ncbi:MAG: HAD-IC family P-type ATPase [Oscillospiraceae bacterium]